MEIALTWQSPLCSAAHREALGRGRASVEEQSETESVEAPARVCCLQLSLGSEILEVRNNACCRAGTSRHETGSPPPVYCWP